jgi:membrane protein DedA with SNARE-associated domain
MYINIGAMVLAGLMNMKTKEFLKNRIFADVLWVSVLTVGSYLILSGLTLLKLRHFEIAIAVFLLVAFSGHALFRKYLAKKTGQS